MARGNQKIKSQQKNAKKTAATKSTTVLFSEKKKIAAKALTVGCPVCKILMPDPKTFKQHFENKHPKATLPDYNELKDVVC